MTVNYFESVSDWLKAGKPLNSFVLGDCMSGMSGMPKKFCGLAICDPPYGIGKCGRTADTSKHGGHKEHKWKDWDYDRPDEKYFDELFRVSENQIIWGANYFTQFLPASMGWILWDKGQRICNSDGELAFTSFNTALRVIEMNRVELLIEGTIHPTQKPAKLYKKILENYAKPNDLILDTHAGSCSSVIACIEMGFEWLAFEKDKDYWLAAKKRIENHSKQNNLFSPQEMYQGKPEKLMLQLE